ncbi:Mitochondrial inner membrane protease ATP23 OS=Cryptococcus neoformans var, neoformans serotype D (strain JEC21 / ATCC MYA-565) GN=ATP23 PE=3 SV=1 [Rhizoctonia solani AG-1 IB]|uniref:Mitochondrial inner membrane protease ATP23 n=2 Tax=Thanatephorus cucumeris (strain AG1-IB / isolate 7/3/14) TaxID=1108050 RepID=A0A0B7FDW9_THACB|nr:Mitochondrial inner membrane protease ATP23 OS=Cryptococcus neoformans var, neoformans serotype D (strain JEC21 / ATCC MYA-565) GN=ATP23 PE=3 SV=1 [Rhizoctonia solani AG-1 IB]
MSASSSSTSAKPESRSSGLETKFGNFRSSSEASAFERWRASLVNFTGLGLSDEDKVKREQLKGLELEEAQWRRCESWKNDLMKNSPVVVFMLKHLALHNTNLTSSHIHCAPCDPTRAGGFSPDAGILLCQDRFMSKSHMQDTLVHEMVHVYDHARFKVDWSDLRHHACSENIRRMGSPPKPWERAGATAAVLDPAPSVPALSATSTDLGVPTVPSRPESIASTQPLTSLSPFSNTSAYGSSSYNSSYSPYNRFGSYGSYGSYGGYGGGMYSGYGMGGGYGMGMNGGMYGQPGMPGDSVAASTQQAFSLLGNVVGTFTSFAQMLDSSFMATQSSIFAILGVAEQLGQLRNLLGQVVGVFGLVGWLRGWWRGERNTTAMARDFKRFMRGDDGTPRPSKKPFIMILLAIFGLPYVMHKLVRALSSRLPPPQSSAPIDMSQVQFATALYDFQGKDELELALNKGDLVAIIGRTEGGDWFRGRTREGKMGWFPANHVQILKKKVEEPVKDVPKSV